jgi:hypothetical protein
MRLNIRPKIWLEIRDRKLFRRRKCILQSSHKLATCENKNCGRIFTQDQKCNNRTPFLELARTDKA